MIVPFIKGLLTGMAFGAVLYKVGATRYSRIMGMLTLRDTKVMKFAFTAIATGCFLYGLAALLGVAEDWHLVPRVMPFLGPAHIVGGVLFGTAMGFTGLCPGTCMAKAGGRGGDKKFVGAGAMIGLLVGVLVYNGTKQPLMDAGVIAANQKPLTVHGVLGLPYGAVAMAGAALFLLIAVTVDRLTPERVYKAEHERKSVVDYLRGEWSWLAAGVAGGTVIVIATMQDGYLGFSGAVLALIGWGADLIGQPLEIVPVINDTIVWRAALALGAIPGGLIAAAVSLKSAAAVTTPAEKVLDVKAIARSFAAGSTLSLGAMLGGGCTTGAFIAAWPTMSLGSFAMAGTFFVVSMAVGNGRLFLKTFDLSEIQAAGDRAYD